MVNKLKFVMGYTMLMLPFALFFLVQLFSGKWLEFIIFIGTVLAICAYLFIAAGLIASAVIEWDS